MQSVICSLQSAVCRLQSAVCSLQMSDTADNSGSHADIILTSTGSTLTKCPSKNAGLLPSETFKDPPIVTYKGYTSSSKIS